MLRAFHVSSTVSGRVSPVLLGSRISELLSLMVVYLQVERVIITCWSGKVWWASLSLRMFELLRCRICCISADIFRKVILRLLA